TVTAPPSAGTLNGNQAICIGGSSTFSSTVTGGSWVSSDASIATIDPSTGDITGIAAGTATMTYTVTGTGGCADATETRDVIVNPLPTPTFDVEPLADVCVGSSVTYTTQSGGGESNYIWSIPGAPGNDYNITAGGTGNSDATVTLTWLTVGLKEVYVYYEDVNGCTPLTSAFNAITVNPLPTPTFEEAPTSDVCVGTTVTYTTQSGAGLSNYVWSISGILGTDYSITAGGTGNTDHSVTLTWLTEGPKDVYVYYANEFGCTPINSAYNTINIIPLPIPTFETEPGNQLCEQDVTTYTTQAGKTDYIWNIPGTAGTDYTITAGGISSNNESVSIQWLTTGIKTVTVSYTEPATGCIATSLATSNTEVKPFATVGPTSVSYPSVCISSPVLTPFTQPTTGVTDIGTPVGLPDGITASFDINTGLITFSGTATTPTVGAQPYSIPLVGDCINGLEATGTIEVSPNYTLSSVNSVSATSIGGSATVTIFGDTNILSNGIYEVTYEIAEGSGSFTQVGPVNVSVTNGKGSFLTIPINDNTETYTVKILSLKKTTDQCTVTLPDPPTTYFGICAAVYSTNGTFYVPANVYSITIEVYGAGGGGNSGVGGGGGAYSIRTNIPVTPGEPLGVFAGQGGGQGASGGTSYVTRDSNIANQLANSLVYAYGGNTNSSGAFSQGTGGFFDSRYSGFNGGSSSGTNGGVGGGPLGGLGGKNRFNGNSPGGGGGGWSGGKGVGGNGLIVISYSCPDADETDCITIIDDGSKSGYTVIEYTCDDTWTAPEGLAEFTVFVGSGGGGGGSGEGSGGGGSGSMIVQTFSTTNPYGLPAGTDFGIVVGNGGPGAIFGERPGTAGEPSEFTGNIDGNSIDIFVAGGGGGGSQIINAGGHGSSGGGGGATPAPNKSFGLGGNAIPLTFTGTPDAVYSGNPGGNGDYNDPQDAIAGGGGGGLVPWKLPPANDGQNGKAAGAGQGEGGRGGDAINLALGDSLRYYGAGGGGIGEYFNGTEKIGEGGSSLLDGTKLGGDGNLDILNTNGIGYSGVDKTGSGGGAGYNGGGKGGDGIIYIVYRNFRILEVEYLYFEAKYNPENRSGELTWATAKEWENAKFEIERSINNSNNWEKIGEVEGQGYADSQSEYAFTDQNLPTSGGNVFYRLKQVDFDETYSYSVTRSIQVPSLIGKTNWIIYPNPSENRSIVTVGLLNLSNYNDEPILVRISDVKGILKTYSATSVEEVNIVVNSYLNDAISGMYIVQLIWGDQSEQLKVIRK
ncbi:T9SS type A sorting domain-containing protein, partial [Algoriphagus sp.]|uniref:T9SS type A sorting domain-containing protein n=1 Tax=Algoriphagus sp. TaxID=1872435 RepID=UPI0025E051EF